MADFSRPKKIIPIATKNLIIQEVMLNGKQPCKVSKSMNLHRKAASKVVYLTKKGHIFQERGGRPSIFDSVSLGIIAKFASNNQDATNSEKINILMTEYQNTLRRAGKCDVKSISRRSLKRYLEKMF